MAFHVLELDDEDVRQFATDMYSARLSVRRCEICGVLTDDERCSLCEDETRDRSVICVVADTRSVMAFEKTGEYRGVYHVLGGLISPLDGIGPDEIGIDKLAAARGDNRDRFQRAGRSDGYVHSAGAGGYARYGFENSARYARGRRGGKYRSENASALSRRQDEARRLSCFILNYTPS